MKKLTDSKNLYKITSLQGWSKLTDKYFKKRLRIKERKDREQIYTLLNKMDLPYEEFRAFKDLDKLTQKEFEKAIKDLGYPYWISATPKAGVTDLDRLSKLRIESVEAGWDFIKSLVRKSDYKVIVMQYADDPGFKGSALVSKKLNGVADFVLGDKHVQLIEGLTLTDPMIFNQQGVVRYSSIIERKYQDELWRNVSVHPGHFEFQYGTIKGKKYLSFFDYNDEPAYENIDNLHQNLIDHYSLNGYENEEYVVKGLPASLGKAYGICRVLLSSDYKEGVEFNEGCVLVTDATKPPMTPFMKRCAAIVTDLGGVTSHAAIVCREMEIPCIVGAKDATQKLKDGTFVLVDAFEGKVKIEKR